MNTSKVFVVSAQDIFRAGVITLARDIPELRVIGESHDLLSSIRSITSSAPDLIILDLYGCDLTQDLPRLYRLDCPLAPKSIVITSASTDYELAQCIQTRVNGVVCRNAASGEMTMAVRKVLSGRMHYCTHTNTKLRTNRSPLTKRELEVLQFLALGLQNKAIAERLAVGVGTIKLISSTSMQSSKLPRERRPSFVVFSND